MSRRGEWVLVRPVWRRVSLAYPLRYSINTVKHGTLVQSYTTQQLKMCRYYEVIVMEGAKDLRFIGRNPGKGIKIRGHVR